MQRGWPPSKASALCHPRKLTTVTGRGVFDRSIAGLRKLNAAGYGMPGTGLTLELVYNPSGGFLAPDQTELEDKYKEELHDQFGISFDSLFTINNMPIKRFADFLARRGELAEYMELLVRNYNPATLNGAWGPRRGPREPLRWATHRPIPSPAGLMCRNTVNVSWDGKLYDCDFNQQLLMGAGTHAPADGAPDGAHYSDAGLDIFGIEALADLRRTDIVLAGHCFGCTAGKGSSCQGATA